MPAKWISKDECEENLENAFYGRLATQGKEGPYIVPVNFAYENNKIYIHSKKYGQKIDNICDHDEVCFEISEPLELVKDKMPCDYGVRFWSVLAYGKAKILEDPKSKLAAAEKIVNKYAEGEPFEKLSEKHMSGIEIISVSVRQMTGKINVDPDEM